MTKANWVTACLPAYKSGAKLHRGIRSVLAQSYPRTRILVSVDGSGADGETVAALNAYESNDRVTVIYRTEQLGWVGNTNQAFAAAGTEFYFYLAHDDHISHDYVDRLVSVLRQNPQAVNAYGSVEWFGAPGCEREAPEGLTGSIVQRLETYLSQDMHGHAMRGITRRNVLDKGAVIPENSCTGLASDIAYIFHLASLGDCLLEPAATYYKYRGDETTSANWANASGEDQVEAFTRLGSIVLEFLFDCLPHEDALRLGATWIYQIKWAALFRSGIKDPVAAEMLLQDMLVRLARGESDERSFRFANVDERSNDPMLKARFGEYKRSEAAHHLSNGALLASAAAFQMSCDATPHDQEAHAGLADVLERLSLTDLSMASARAALEIQPNHAGALACVMRQAFNKQDLDLAKAMADQIIETNPKNHLALQILKRIDEGFGAA